MFFLNIWIKFFFLFTPFFALTMFLTLTTGYSQSEKHKLALNVTIAVGIVCFIIFFFGRHIFSLFGITLDAFRVGAGCLLFLSAVGLVQSQTNGMDLQLNEDIAVVPLAIPVIVGPATIGTLLVLSAEITEISKIYIGCLALGTAVISIGMLLFFGSFIEKFLGKKGIQILSKITGLILSALAAQMVLTGVKHFIA